MITLTPLLVLLTSGQYVTCPFTSCWKKKKTVSKTTGWFICFLGQLLGMRLAHFWGFQLRTTTFYSENLCLPFAGATLNNTGTALSTALITTWWNMAGHENGIPHFTLIFHTHDVHLTANSELPFAAKAHIHAEDAGSTWPRGLQAHSRKLAAGYWTVSFTWQWTVLHPFPDLTSLFTQVSCSWFFGFPPRSSSSRWVHTSGGGGRGDSSTAELERWLVLGDRKKGRKRKGEGGGEV